MKLLHASINTGCSVTWSVSSLDLDLARDTAQSLWLASAIAAALLLLAARGRLGMPAEPALPDAVQIRRADPRRVPTA